MKILVFGYGHKSTAAVSNILLNLSKSITEKEKIEIVLFGYGEKNSKQNVNELISIVSCRDVFLKHFSFYRLARKISYIFKLDKPCLSWKRLYKKANTIFANDRFDFVLGASGYFMYMNAAYHFAKKNNIKFGMLNFDPFASNITTLNKNKRLKLEQKWYDFASFVLQNRNGNKSLIKDEKSKISDFQIPMFKKEFVYSPKGSIVYGGSFYGKFRSEDELLRFFKKQSCQSEHFDVYSNCKNSFTGFSNVTTNDFVDSESFDEVCKHSKALLVVGNNNVNALPSKVIEAFSYKKPIIGINMSALQDVLTKYPFYLDSEDSNIFDKIDNFSEDDFIKYDVYSSFPELNPEIMVSLLLEKFK